MTNFVELAFIFIGITALILLPLSILLLRLTLDRRIRKQLAADKEYNNYPDWYFGFGRAIIFGYASVWDRANNSWQIKTFYDGFDVKNFANRFERFITYSLFFSLTILMIGGVLFIVLEILGIINRE